MLASLGKLARTGIGFHRTGFTASSAESVGSRWFRKPTKIVIESGFHGIVGSESVGTSGHDPNLVVESLDRATGDLALGFKPIVDEMLVRPHHSRHFLHRLQATAQRSGAPGL